MNHWKKTILKSKFYELEPELAWSRSRRLNIQTRAGAELARYFTLLTGVGAGHSVSEVELDWSRSRKTPELPIFDTDAHSTQSSVELHFPLHDFLTQINFESFAHEE